VIAAVIPVPSSTRIPNPESRIPDVREEQGRSTGCDHPPVDFRNFEMTVDRSLDRDDVIVTAEAVDEGAEIWK
jgi:hypothetical protein